MSLKLCTRTQMMKVNINVLMSTNSQIVKRINTLFRLHLVAVDEGSTTSNQRQENKGLLFSFQSTDLDDNSPSNAQEHPDLTLSPPTKVYVCFNSV